MNKVWKINWVLFGVALGIMTALLLSLSGCNTYYLNDIHDDPPPRDPKPNVVYVDVPGDPPPPVDPDVWVDTFEQPDPYDGIDIVWVLDKSCSMYDDEEEVLSGIDTMMNALPAAGGWRLNMISIDPQQSVTEAQFPLVPGDDAGDAWNMYQNIPNSRLEQGFLSIHDYMEYNTYARTWMRADAALLVVFVSDEEEQSQNFFPLADDFIDWYTDQRPNVFLASIIHDMPGPSYTPDCRYGVIDYGERYLDATDLLGGVVIDICTSDWSTGVTEASTNIEPYERWELTQPAIEGSIVVFVDGVLFTDWIYNPTDNAVEFTVLPPGGSHVEIAYAY